MLEVAGNHELAQVQLDFLLDCFSKLGYLDRCLCRFQVPVNEVLRPIMHLFELLSLLADVARIGGQLPVLLQDPVNVGPLEIESPGKLPDRNFFIKVKVLKFRDQL